MNPPNENGVISLVSDRDGIRIDLYLSEILGRSRTRVADLIGKGLVTLNGKPVKKNAILEENDRISFCLPPDENPKVEPENIPLDVVFEDSDLIVVNKPQGMVVHPAPGHWDHTLVNALLYHCGSSLSGINGILRPGIVHRIDQYTSGLLVAAKNDRTHNALSLLFQNHDFIRRYHGIVYGSFQEDEGVIETGIGRSKTDRKKMAAYPLDTPNTKRALTRYRVLEHFSGYSYVEFTLETGRTHQIRVHAARLGHPVLDDKIYAPGRPGFGLDGQCLHAKILGFTHPVTGYDLYFDSPLPDYFQSILTVLRKDCK